MDRASFSAVVVGDAGITVRCLDILRLRGQRLAGVVTADWRVSQWATTYGVPILWHCSDTQLCVADIRGLLANESFDVLFSIHNVRIFTPDLLSLPQRFAVNYHDALLPRYAGLHATTWAIARGEMRHGISWHIMARGIDAGDILEQRACTIMPNDTAWSLGARVSDIACAAFASLVDQLATGAVSPQPQNLRNRSYFASWLTPTRGCLLPSQASAEELDRLFRALQFEHADNPLGLPAVRIGKEVIAIEALELMPPTSDGSPPGTVIRAKDGAVEVRTRSGNVRLTLNRWPSCDPTQRVLQDADEGDEIEWATLRRAVQKNEAWWIERLANLRPFAPPSLMGDVREGFAAFVGILPVENAEQACLALLHAMMTEQDGDFDVAISEPGLRARLRGLGATGLFVEAPPMRVPGCGQTLDAARLTALRCEVAARATFTWDLTRRIRRLRGTKEPSVRLTFTSEECDLSALTSCKSEAVLDAVIAPDGSTLTLKSRTASTEELESFFNRVRGFADLPLQLSAQPADDGDTFLTRFRRCVTQHPDAVAIEAPRNACSYAALASRIARLALALRRRGAGRDAIVAVCTQDLGDLVTAMLGILQSGSAFLVIDLEDSPARNAQILADANPRLLIGHPRLRSLRPLTPWYPLSIAETSESSTSSLSEPKPRDLVYVAYTSGSTGHPKGVAIQHGALVSFLDGVAPRYCFGPGDRILQFGTPTFDLAYEQIFGALASGATLVGFAGRYSGPRALLEVCEQLHITVLDLPTAVFAQISRAVERELLPIPSRIRLTIVGGDTLHREDVARWLDASGTSRLLNGYGPTETTIAVLFWEAPAKSTELPALIPIGIPLESVIVLIVDAEGRRADEGELLIAGAQLARGYYAHPELTARSFVMIDGERFYRTGDRARYGDQGQLELFGRIDRQIKIGSRRVEPAEIETVLKTLDDVTDAAVVPQVADDGATVLRAWVETAKDAGLTVSSVRNQLVRKLPSVLRPTRIDLCEALPRLGSGKINFADLREWSSGGNIVGVKDRPLSAGTESVLARLWDELLSCGPVPPDTDFFDLGGDSLAAVQLLEGIDREFGIKLPLRHLLNSSTIESLASALANSSPVPTSTCLIPLQSEGNKPPLFCVHGVGGHVIRLLSLGSALAPSQPLYGIQSRGLDDDRAPLQTIEEMASTYLDEIEGFIPADASLWLIGKSLGGVVAYEMARQALQRGRTVAFLGLLDTDLAPFFQEIICPPSAIQRAITWCLTLRKGMLGAWRRSLRIAAGGSRDPQLPGEYRNFRRVNATNRRAAERYRLRPYSGTVTFFAAEMGNRVVLEAFRAATGCKFKVVEVEGNHLSMVENPHVVKFAEALTNNMNSADLDMIST